jgi:hypothetical protein
MTTHYWHFVQVDKHGTPRLGYEDNREVRVGETLTVEGEPVLCERGLHASAKLWDALGYAQGDKRALCRVTLGGTVKHDENKSVGNERTVVAMLDADATDKLLRDFARWCALQVIHLWDAPDVVRQYLDTGDESLRDAARDAAGYAAGYAARDAAGYAVGVAAGYAAGDAAGYAVGVAARDAAGYAARGAEIERYASELERRAMKALEAQVIP